MWRAENKLVTHHENPFVAHLDVLLKYAEIVRDVAEGKEIMDVAEFEDWMRTNFTQMEKIKELMERLLQSSPGLESFKEKGESVTTDDTSDEPTSEETDSDTDEKMESVLERAATFDKGEDFDQLHYRLKKCLMCLSIFPPNVEIEKQVLIYWWIAEGFVRPGPHTTAEEEGERYFNELLKHEFIHPVYKRRTRAVPKCMVNPWIQWLLISKARESGMFFFDETGTPSSFEYPRPCLKSNLDNRLQEKQRHPRRLRWRQPLRLLQREQQRNSLISLFNLSMKYLNASIQPFSKMKVTIVAQLGKWRGPGQDDILVENPSFLSNLSLPTSLKYLSLRGILGIKELPNSITELTNLLILDLKNCANMEKLNDKIGNLGKLTHFNISGCYLVQHMPKGIGSLHKLEVLKGFVLGCPKDNGSNPCTMSELAQMQNLRKLSMRVVGKGEIDKDLWEVVGKMSSLVSLAITWCSSSICPPSVPLRLKKLDLRRFPNEPEWINPSMLEKLRKLYIRGGTLESLFIWEKKLNIVELHLQHLQRLQLSWSALQYSFPKLAYLEIHDCDGVLMDMPEKPRNSDGLLMTIDIDAREIGTSSTSPVSDLP